MTHFIWAVTVVVVSAIWASAWVGVKRIEYFPCNEEEKE